MEVSKFTLELDEWVIGACDVAGTAGSGAHAGRALNHGAYYLGMLTHAEIIVRTPDHDVACAMNARLYLVGACTGRSAGFSPTSGASATSSAAYLHVRLVVALGCPLGREGEIAEIGSLLRGAFCPEDEKLASILSSSRFDRHLRHSSSSQKRKVASRSHVSEPSRRITTLSFRRSYRLSGGFR